MYPKSTHIPEVAGAVELVTGSLTVETGLREIQTFSVTMAQAPTATEASPAGVLEDVIPGKSQRLILKVVAADGVTPGVAMAKVAWLALGK